MGLYIRSFKIKFCLTNRKLFAAFIDLFSYHTKSQGHQISTGWCAKHLNFNLKIFEKMKAIELYWFVAQQKTNTFNLDIKSLACFTWNLFQNLMSLVLISESNC